MLGGRASRSTTPSKQFTIHNGRLALCCRARRSTSYLRYGFRKAGPLCETHCKPRSGAAVGKMSLSETSFPEGGLMLLVVSRMYKSRFAEHAATAEFYPQLRRFTACSGLRIEVYLRHTRGSVLSSETQQGVIGSQAASKQLIIHNGRLAQCWR